LSRADRDTFIREYWDRMPKEVPDEYSRPEGEPYDVKVSRKVYDNITSARSHLQAPRRNVKNQTTQSPSMIEEPSAL
jgi:hypothetical protein